MLELSNFKTFRLPAVGQDLGRSQQCLIRCVLMLNFGGRRKSRLVTQGNKKVIPVVDLWMRRKHGFHEYFLASYVDNQLTLFMVQPSSGSSGCPYSDLKGE
jgi:hypothetical protein